VAWIKANGGGDTPKDVSGILNQALKLQWPELSDYQIFFYLACASAHVGAKYHGH